MRRPTREPPRQTAALLSADMCFIPLLRTGFPQLCILSTVAFSRRSGKSPRFIFYATLHPRTAVLDIAHAGWYHNGINSGHQSGKPAAWTDRLCLPVAKRCIAPIEGNNASQTSDDLTIRAAATRGSIWRLTQRSSPIEGNVRVAHSSNTFRYHSLPYDIQLTRPVFILPGGFGS